MHDFEKNTVSAMIRIYCCGKHSESSILCSECKKLEAYAFERLDRCSFGKNKPNCKDCRIHCYKPEMKEKIQDVMRYSGPRMIFRHPIQALGYLFKKFNNKKG